MSALPFALTLATAGFAVFPCLATKAPACPHGFKDATTDPAEVHQLWRHWPGALVGVPTGAHNGFDVLDVDPRHGGDVWLAQHRASLPQTRIHETRSGGLHILFRHHEAVRNSAGKVAPGIDVRDEGGFIIWWPASSCRVLTDNPLAEWPDWLLALLLPAPSSPSSEPWSWLHPRQDTLTFAERTIARVLARLEMAAPGQRHERLRAASVTLGGLANEAGFSDAEAERVLFDAVKRAGGDAVAERNARATIAWGLARGRRSPLCLVEDR
jgi:hypothetical protein